MKELLEYRDNSYFNDNDYFLMYDLALNKFFLNTVECGDKGGAYFSKYRKAMDFKYKFWYNEGPSQYKMTSILCVNANELIGRTVRYLHRGKYDYQHKITDGNNTKWVGIERNTLRQTDLFGKITSNFVLNGVGTIPFSGQSDSKKKWGFPYYFQDPNLLELL